ncbi:hypothetical protein [Nostoc sp. UHCC 0251]|uniref:hypothetical protein n=1 Tax=Nostoc sp. UHCC 0251 TaxID=3110240 RepID=UPI002B20407B|nr:hypothetical protein [Nostoc sp. UHCC 0251]MEA5626660.1 hypothetical protein [Nostoc sp. UHCC 0251]
MSLLQTILVCDNYEIGGSLNYHSRIFSGIQADLMVVTITVSASDQKIQNITSPALRRFPSQKSTVLQVIYKAFKFSAFFSSFKSNNVKLFTPSFGTMPIQSKN